MDTQHIAWHYPTADTLKMTLATATSLVDPLKENFAYDRILTLVDRAVRAFGVEYVASTKDNAIFALGLSYVNIGDTYRTTVVFDHATGAYHITSLGDYLEYLEGIDDERTFV